MSDINKNKDKNKNKNKNKKINIEDSIVRQIYKWIYKKFTLKSIVGNLYYNIHFYFMFTIIFITFFSTSLWHLLVILVIISFDAISIIFLHECPLTGLEKKYLGKTGYDEHIENYKKSGIMYNCNHQYEKQIELSINAWLLVTLKMLTIVFFEQFNIKLQDASNIYA